MSKTLDEFIESYSAVKFLQKNLRCNIEVYCEDMPKEEQENFLRMNMTMFRQCLQDFGAE